MAIAFVIGNGVSRQHISLDSLRPLGKIYGCNALYREFVPDVLVATDRPIATQIQETGYAISNKFYTRRPIPGLGAHALSKDYFGYSSGPNAVGLAAQARHAQIYMLGFDMGPIPGNGFNNIYANTEFYKSSDALPTYTGNWIKQIVKIVHDHPETEFIRVCGRTTARIQELDTLKNLKHLELAQFLDRINNQKDF